MCSNKKKELINNKLFPEKYKKKKKNKKVNIFIFQIYYRLPNICLLTEEFEIRKRIGAYDWLLAVSPLAAESFYRKRKSTKLHHEHPRCKRFQMARQDIDLES